MFLCIILKGFSLRFQRAQDHRNQSPDEKNIAVFVLLVLSVFRKSDIPGLDRNIRPPSLLELKTAKDQNAQPSVVHRIFDTGYFQKDRIIL